MRKQRILFSDNGTLNDFTVNLGNYYSGTNSFPFVANQDFLYIGSPVPFNHFYVKFGTANTAASNLTVQYYSGLGWNNVAEVIDETQGFTQDGFVEFVPDKTNGWVQQDTSGSGGTISELNTVEIYDKYWMRVGFDSDLDAETTLSWLGYLFSNDNDLKTEFPDLLRTNVLTAFQAGKTDWEEQHVRAGEIVVQDLIKKSVINFKGQILRRERFTLASVQKVAEIVFNSFGDDYLDNRNAARKEYNDRLNVGLYDTDKNADGRLGDAEMRYRQGWLGR